MLVEESSYKNVYYKLGCFSRIYHCLPSCMFPRGPYPGVARPRQRLARVSYCPQMCALGIAESFRWRCWHLIDIPHCLLP